MTDLPERIWANLEARNSGLTLIGKIEHRTWDYSNTFGPHGITTEYVRVVPAEDDAGDDARIAAASRREWAERAWGAEAELKEARMQSLSNAGQAQEAYERQLELEAERDKLREALEKIEQIGQ